MAVHLRMTHLMECDIDAFWPIFFDEELNHKIFVTDMGFAKYRVLDGSNESKSIRRKLEITPNVPMPAAVAKILGERFTYLEVGRFEEDDQAYHFELVPPGGVLAGKVTSGGVATAEAAHGGKTRRIVEMNIEVRLWGAGGMLESFAAKAAEEAYAAHAELANEYLRAR